MGGYTNGNWPESMFEVYATGRDEDGPWKHLLTAGTRHKLDRLKELAYKRTGRRLEVSPGWSCYRPIGPQRVYRARYGNGAAYPGTSSHGINWLDGERGWRVCLAIDIHNWGWVYGWNRDTWYADCRTAGFAPGLIHPSRGHGYPDEPWHIIDLEPFAAPPKPKPETFEEDDMAYIANVKNGNFYCITGTKAHKLGAASGARQSGMPIINYADDWAVAQLKTVVTGIGNH